MLAFKNIEEFKSTVNSVIDENPKVCRIESRIGSIDSKIGSLELKSNFMQEDIRQIHLKLDGMTTKMDNFLDGMGHLFYRENDLNHCLESSRSQKENLAYLNQAVIKHHSNRNIHLSDQ